MEYLYYLGILKEGFSAYSSPVMLISRKVTQEKRVVTYFRHLNIRIAKYNLAYPLLKDTFSVLGSSRCEVLSVLGSKDAFHSLRLLENSKRYYRILPYFGSTSYFLPENAYEIEYFTFHMAVIHKHNISIACKVGYIVRQLWMIFSYSPHLKDHAWQN